MRQSQTGGVTRKDFETALRSFDADFRKCLDALLSLKHGVLHKDADVVRDFQTFQARLYRSLLALSRLYQSIAGTRKHLIARKRMLSPEWFRKRQRKLSDYQEVLQRAIRAGRTLGDAFVWFFYRNDLALLDQHVRQPSPSLPPAGIGGDGELALVDGVRRLGNKFILFHGITSLFRIGDASLFDFQRQRIVGIGELKTFRINNRRLQLEFVTTLKADVAADFSSPLKTDSSESRQPLTARQNTRLEKQLKTMLKASEAATAQPAAKVTLERTKIGHAKELNALLSRVRSNSFAFEQVSDGLLLMAFREPSRSLARRLRGRPESQPLPDTPDLGDRVKGLMLRGSDYNSMFLNSAFYGRDGDSILMPGTTPLFWWPLGRDVLRDMVLQKTIVMTIFNPAHLMTALERQGFSVKTFEPPNTFVLTYQRGPHVVTLENFAYFLRLIAVSLLSENYVIDLIVDSLKEVPDDGRRYRVDLHFTHDMLGVKA